MTSSKGNIFRVTGPLWGKSTDPWWIPLTKASSGELWYFLWCAPQQTASWANSRDTGDFMCHCAHYDVIVKGTSNTRPQWRQISVRTFQFTCLPTVSIAVCSGWHQKEHQRSASLALFEGNPPVIGGSPHKGPVMRKAVPCHDVIMKSQ